MRHTSGSIDPGGSRRSTRLCRRISHVQRAYGYKMESGCCIRWDRRERGMHGAFRDRRASALWDLDDTSDCRDLKVVTREPQASHLDLCITSAHVLTKPTTLVSLWPFVSYSGPRSWRSFPRRDSLEGHRLYFTAFPELAICDGYRAFRLKRDCVSTGSVLGASVRSSAVVLASECIALGTGRLFHLRKCRTRPTEADLAIGSGRQCPRRDRRHEACWPNDRKGRARATLSHVPQFMRRMHRRRRSRRQVSYGADNRSTCRRDKGTRVGDSKPGVPYRSTPGKHSSQ